MDDQVDMWNQKHAAHEHAAMENSPTSFALELAEQIHLGNKILELGCGVGSDARYFASLGAEVFATDFSSVVIDQNKARAQSQNLTYKVMDITKPFTQSAEIFDIVYAHLSLHYFETGDTQKIFKEIARVLRPKGVLYFSYKSVHDPKYGEGEVMASNSDIFSRQGHIRHFFSLDYTRQLLAEDYQIITLTETKGFYSDGMSAFINCSAVKNVRAGNT